MLRNRADGREASENENGGRRRMVAAGLSTMDGRHGGTYPSWPLSLSPGQRQGGLGSVSVASNPGTFRGLSFVRSVSTTTLDPIGLDMATDNARKKRTEKRTKTRRTRVSLSGVWDSGNGSWVKCTGETCRAAVPRPSSFFPRCSSLAARRAALVVQDGAVRLQNAPDARRRYWLSPRFHAFFRLCAGWRLRPLPVLLSTEAQLVKNDLRRVWVVEQASRDDEAQWVLRSADSGKATSEIRKGPLAQTGEGEAEVDGEARSGDAQIASPPRQASTHFSLLSWGFALTMARDNGSDLWMSRCWTRDGGSLGGRVAVGAGTESAELRSLDWIPCGRSIVDPGPDVEEREKAPVRVDVAVTVRQRK